MDERRRGDEAWSMALQASNLISYGLQPAPRNTEKNWLWPSLLYAVFICFLF